MAGLTLRQQATRLVEDAEAALDGWIGEEVTSTVGAYAVTLRAKVTGAKVFGKRAVKFQITKTDPYVGIVTTWAMRKRDTINRLVEVCDPEYAKKVELRQAEAEVRRKKDFEEQQRYKERMQPLRGVLAARLGTLIEEVYQEFTPEYTRQLVASEASSIMAGMSYSEQKKATEE